MSNSDCGCGGTVQSAPSSCNPNFPTSCESLGSGTIVRIVGEDSASCKYTVPVLNSNSLLAYNSFNNVCNFVDGSPKNPIFLGNSSSNQASADSILEIQGTTKSGQLVAFGASNNSEAQIPVVATGSDNSVRWGTLENLLPTQGLVYQSFPAGSPNGKVKTLTTRDANKFVSFDIATGDPIIVDPPTPPTPPGSTIPAGMVMAFAGPQGYPGAGWIVCDGKYYNNTDYPDLYKAIGGQYGAQGGQFAVPNLQGCFIRGAGAQTINGVTYGDSFGGPHYDSFQGHFHATSANQLVQGGPLNFTGSGMNFVYSPVYGPTNDGVNGQPRTGIETRPVNFVMYWYIKT